jgi:hypothetical protein
MLEIFDAGSEVALLPEDFDGAGKRLFAIKLLWRTWHGFVLFLE